MSQRNSLPDRFERILVLGATGVLGRPVANRLVERGYSVRTLTRNVDKARPLLHRDIEIIEGSATDPAQVSRAAADCHAVHISVSTDVEPAAVQCVVDHANVTDLRRISYVSATTAFEENRWFHVVDVKLRAEALLRSSGIPLVVFCPTWVMEVLKNFVKQRRGVIIHGRQAPPIHFFAARDFARIVTSSYEDDRAVGKRLFVHGPEAFTLPDALEYLFASSYPRLPVMHLKLWQAKLIAALNGRIRRPTELIAYFDRVGELGDPTEANEMFGAPATSLREWVRSV